MKLLVDCVPLSTGGGVQVAIAFLSNLQSRKDWDWVAIAPSRIRHLLPEGLINDSRVSFVNFQDNWARLQLPSQLRSIEKREKPDIVFTIFGPALFRASAVHVVGFARPHMIYDREAWMPRRKVKDVFLDLLRQVQFRTYDHIFVETETAKARLSERVRIPLNKITTIPNSVNPLLKRSANSELPQNSEKIVLVPSAWYWHKRLEIVPEIALAAMTARPDLKIHFRFTLDPKSDGWLSIVGIAQGFGVEKSFSTLGVLSISDLGPAYEAADLVLLPTVREVSTAVYPESFYFGRPLVTSDLDFARDLCGDAALLVAPEKTSLFAAAIVKLLSEPGLAIDLKTRGEAQLEKAYPTAEEKFEMQIRNLTRIHGQYIAGRERHVRAYDDNR